MEKKIVYVVALVLENEKGEFLLVQRTPSKAYPFYWEFPGGKIEENEIPTAALVREIQEEIGLIINPQDLTPITFSSYSYPTIYCTILYFHCRHWKGNITLKESQPSYGWFPKQNLKELKMPEGNYLFLNYLESKHVPLN